MLSSQTLWRASGDPPARKMTAPQHDSEWDKTLREDPYQQDFAYGGSGVFQPSRPPIAGQPSAAQRSGQASPTIDQSRQLGEGSAPAYATNDPAAGARTETGRGRVQISEELPNLRAGYYTDDTIKPHQRTTTDSTLTYPPGYPPAGSSYPMTSGKAGLNEDLEVEQQQQQHWPDPQSYRSNSSAEWARLLNRAGYAAAPQADDSNDHRH
ncbi:unnamed protein product, partial [Tilletia controversa]